MCWSANYENPYQMKGSQRVSNVVLLQGGSDCVPCMEKGCECHNDNLSDCLENMSASVAINALYELHHPALSSDLPSQSEAPLVFAPKWV